MRQLTVLLIAAILVFVPLEVHTQETAVPHSDEELPEFLSGRVQLSWEDFRELLDQLRVPEETVVKEVKPPTDWVLNSAAYTAEVSEEGRVRVDVRMELFILNADDWVTIPVLHESVAPVLVRLDGESTALSPDSAGWYSLMLKDPGQHTFESSFYVTVSKSEGRAFFEYPTPRVPMTTMALSIPMPEARVSSPSAARVSTTVAENFLAVDLAFKSTDTIRVEWVSPALDEQPPQKVEPLVSCSTFTMAQVSETHIGLISKIQFNMLRGAVDTFRASLPFEANVFSVDGPQGIEWRIQKGDSEQVIEVSLNHEVSGSTWLKIEYEAPIEPDAQSFEIPELQVLDTLRANGYIAIAANPNVELSPGESIANLSRVNKAELAPDFTALAKTPVTLAFRYNSNGYTLPLEMLVTEPRVASAAQTLVHISDTHLALTSHLRFDVLRGAVNGFRLALPVATNVLNITGEGIVWSVEQGDEDQTISISLDREILDSYELTLQYETPLPEDPTTIQIPELQVLDMLRSTGYVAIATNDNVELSPGEGITNLSRVNKAELSPDFTALAKSPVTLAFRYNSSGYTLPLEMLVTDPRVASAAQTLVRISNTHLALTSNLQFEVTRGAVNGFRLALPVGTNILNITGEGIVWSVEEGDEGQMITISLDRKIVDSYELTLHYETPLPEDPTTIQIPELTVLDTVRSTGDIAVTVSGNLELKIGEYGESLRRIDESELPKNLRTLPSSPILYAFHYNADRYRLGFETRKLEDIAVQVAVIDEAHITTLITNQNISTTQVYYAVRNNERQFLRVSLREGAEVLGARVAGRSVKPSRDGETKAVLLPLIKSGPDGAAFLVELIYMEHYPEPDAQRLTLALEAPATDMKIDEMFWDVRIPKSSRIFNIETDLERLESITNMARPVTQQTIGVNQETVFRYREGIERLLITDINNAGASNLGGSKGYGGKPRAPLAKDEHDPAIDAVAGVMPLRVSLPQGGSKHSFRQIFVPKDTRLAIFVDLGEKTARSRRAISLGAMSLLLGALARLSLGAGSRPWAMRVVMVPLIPFLIYTAWTWQVTSYIALAFGSGVLITFLSFRYRQVLKRRRQSTDSEKEETSPSLTNS